VSTIASIGVVKGASDNNQNLAYGSLAAQFATAFASMTFRNKSIMELDRAIQIRNREVLFIGR
jgi:hypothetical protein